MIEFKKYLGRERRRFSRYPVALAVEFYVWDIRRHEALTEKVQGLLTDISHQGACLQSNRTMIGGHHLLLDDDLEGNTPVLLTLPSSPEEDPLLIQAQVLWYNRVSVERKYQFDIGVKFVNLSSDQQQRLEALIKRQAAKGE